MDLNRRLAREALTSKMKEEKKDGSKQENSIIDLSTGKIDIKPIPLEIRKKFIGGRGLDAYLLYNHTEKGATPLVLTMRSWSAVGFCVPPWLRQPPGAM